MKIRHIVFGILTAVCLVTAILLSVCRGAVTKDNVRDFAAENYSGASGDRYTQLALYLGEDGYLTPDVMMEIKNTLEGKITEYGADSTKYLLSGSTEKTVNLMRGALSTEALATVYFGDWFGLHPHVPARGGYVDESAATTDFCVIDDYVAWKMFGSTDVCGLELEIDGKIYTVSAVLHADRSVYAPYYGEKPRVYILYSSAAVRDERVNFTSLEAVLPNPVDGAAEAMFKDAVASLSDEVYTVSGRFTASELFDNIKNVSKLGVMEGKDFPYYENIARIMETKCALILAFETAFYILAAVSFWILLVLIFRPLLSELKEKRSAKKRHAIY